MNPPYFVRVLLAVAAVIVLIAWLLNTLEDALNLPVVYVSTSTGKCVRVESPRLQDSCRKLPRRYERVWVE
jgi:hypothetical protein